MSHNECMKNKNNVSGSNNQPKNNNTMQTNNNAVPVEVIEYLESYFETYNTLPTPVIECNVSGTAYTAFGTNLKNKIEKAGGLKELLTTFVGRGMKVKEKAKKSLDQKIQEVRTEVQTAKKARPSRSKAAIAARAAAKAQAVTA
jgi:hypothetical protein